MSVNYAQLDAENICVGISQLSGAVELPYMLPIETPDISLIGKKYNNGVWEEVETEEPEVSTDEYQQYYETVNAAVLGGDS